MMHAPPSLPTSAMSALRSASASAALVPVVTVLETLVCAGLHDFLCPPFDRCSRWHVREQYTTDLHLPHHFEALLPHPFAHARSAGDDVSFADVRFSPWPSPLLSSPGIGIGLSCCITDLYGRGQVVGDYQCTRDPWMVTWYECLCMFEVNRQFRRWSSRSHIFFFCEVLSGWGYSQRF